MPNKVGQVYVCEICGNKVEMIVAGKGTLHCCGQPMKLAGEKKYPKHLKILDFFWRIY
jgi:desulfoferrodoxin-like iron-binding protein